MRALILVLLLAAAAAGGWFLGRHPRDAAPAAPGRKVTFYQSPMHPWIKSDKPGKCTICGMNLVPVYEGEKGFGGDQMISLGTNIASTIHVQATPVVRTNLGRTLRLAGMIDDDDTRHRQISAYVEGRVDRLMVNFVGAEVKAGEPMALLYSPTLLVAEREYLNLAGRTGITPAIATEHSNLVGAAATRLRRLGLSEAQIRALPGKTNVTHTEILAPIDGTVIERHVYEGQYVKEGEKLFTLADFSRMWFRFDAYERDLPWLRVGQTIEVTTPSLPGRVFRSEINFLEPNIAEKTQTATGRVILTNAWVESNGQKRRELFHKLYAEATVNIAISNVLAIPRTAVLGATAEPRVYLELDPGNYRQQIVQLGRSGDTLVEVLSGLKEGDRVVTSGNLLIDAQSELQSSSEGPSEKPPATPPASWNLQPPEQKVVMTLFDAADRIAQALAADDLAAFNRDRARAASASREALQALPGNHPARPLLAAIELKAALPQAADLAAARKAFHPFSMATADLLRVTLQQTDWRPAKLFACPMANQAVPGAPKKGFWIQTKGPLRNPFFGSEMIDCGSEEKP